MDEARRRWTRAAIEIGDELRAARHLHGLTQLQVARAVGVSDSEISRRELGRSNRLTGRKLAIHAAAVGLRVSIRFWPVGGPIRDAAQARYISAFVARVGRPWTVRLEVPVPVAGDLRAVDVLLASSAARIAVEVITRLADLQAQVRAVQLKARDLGATRLILVVAATHANRRALAGARGTLVGSFELDSRRLLAELAGGRDPGRDGIILLSLAPGSNGH